MKLADIMERALIRSYEEETITNLLLLLASTSEILIAFPFRFIRALFAHKLPIPYVVRSEADWISQSKAEILVEEAIAYWEKPAGCKLFKKSNRGLEILFSNTIPESNVIGICCPVSSRITIYRHKKGDCDVRTTVAHELGHALCLLHSKGIFDVMRYTNVALEHISIYEEEIMRKRYGKKKM